MNGFIVVSAIWFASVFIIDCNAASITALSAAQTSAALNHNTANSSTSLKKVYVYQGRHAQLFSDQKLTQLLRSKGLISANDSVILSGDARLNLTAKYLAKFDILTLTHIFHYKSEPNALNDFQTVFNTTYQALALDRSNVDSGTFFHSDYRKVNVEFIRKIRSYRSEAGLPPAEIFGYVPLTIDSPVAWPTSADMNEWANFLPAAKGLTHANFMANVDAWKNLSNQPGAQINGLFLDMASEVYVSKIGLINMLTYAKDSGFKIMPNIVSTASANLIYSGCTAYVNSVFVKLGIGDSRCNLMIDAVGTFKDLRRYDGQYLMGAGDYLLLEGYPLRQGNYTQYTNDYLAGLDPVSRLTELRNTRQVQWLMVPQEVGYSPTCGASSGTAGGTPQTEGCSSAASAKVVNCNSGNYSTLKTFASNNGASGLFYTEANLGLHSDELESHCSN